MEDTEVRGHAFYLENGIRWQKRTDQNKSLYLYMPSGFDRDIIVTLTTITWYAYNEMNAEIVYTGAYSFFKKEPLIFIVCRVCLQTICVSLIGTQPIQISE